MDYTSSLIWLTTWPLIIWLGYRFVKLNITELQRREER